MSPPQFALSLRTGYLKIALSESFSVPERFPSDRPTVVLGLYVLAGPHDCPPPVSSSQLQTRGSDREHQEAGDALLLPRSQRECCRQSVKTPF